LNIPTVLYLAQANENSVTYHFDGVFGPQALQEEVFDEIKSFV
jgi:hypothetical protein